jgi:aminoglycoside phosphotransferase (APT) family kinase protein
MAPMDQTRLLRLIDARFPTLGDGPLVLTALAGGSSSSVYRVTRGGKEAVLRLPAWPPRADSLKAMGREARVLGALAGSDVPHPRLLTYGAEETEIGVPFMLMEFVEGWLGAHSAPAAFSDDAGAQKELAFAMVDSVIALNRLDYLAAGLADFGKPDRFLERQVDRWLAQRESYKVTENHPGRAIPGLDYVADWLRANTPAMAGVGLIHGDISLANILFDMKRPARVAAIIDWEIATLGDPLLDLGRALFPMPGRRVGSGVNRMADYSGYPTREDLAEYYTASTGLSTDNINYYIVLSMFKLACIIEFNYARWITGRDRNELAGRISEYILDIIRDAKLIAQSTG